MKRQRPRTLHLLLEMKYKKANASSNTSFLPTHTRTEKPKLPENFEANTWDKLHAAVKAVHTKSG